MQFSRRYDNGKKVRLSNEGLAAGLHKANELRIGKIVGFSKCGHYIRVNWIGNSKYTEYTYNTNFLEIIE